MHDWMSILDPATVADLIGADAIVWGEADAQILAWAERVWPDADPLDRYAFAELAGYLASGLLAGWGVLDRERPRDVAARQLVEAATGNPGGGVVQRIQFDADGRHAPPGYDSLASIAARRCSDTTGLSLGPRSCVDILSRRHRTQRKNA